MDELDELELDELELDELELDEDDDVDSSITPVVVSSTTPVVVSSTLPVVVSSSVVELESTRPDAAVLEDAASVVEPALALMLASPLMPVVRGPEVASGEPVEPSSAAPIVALENGLITSEPHPSPSTAIQETTRQARRMRTPKPETIAGFGVPEKG